MNCLISELQRKEVVDISDGTRFGYIGDLELNTVTGEILNIVIAGRKHLFGFGSRDLISFPWNSIRRIGTDIILIDAGNNLSGMNNDSPTFPSHVLQRK